MRFLPVSHTYLEMSPDLRVLLKLPLMIVILLVLYHQYGEALAS